MSLARSWYLLAEHPAQPSEPSTNQWAIMSQKSESLTSFGLRIGHYKTHVSPVLRGAGLGASISASVSKPIEGKGFVSTVAFPAVTVLRLLWKFSSMG